MANLPRFGYTRQRFSSESRPGSATRLEAQRTAEPEYFSSAPAAATNILQTSPLKERWRISAPSSPKTVSPTYTSPPRSPAKPKYSTTTAAAAAPLFPVDLPSLVVKREPEHTPPSRSPPEVQEKTMILYEQRRVDKAAKTEHRAREYSSGKAQQKQQESDVINMKGENVGAVMHITQSSEIHKINKPNKSSSNIPAKSFMNTNFQGVNNSILCNSSLSRRNPGLLL